MRKLSLQVKSDNVFLLAFTNYKINCFWKPLHHGSYKGGNYNYIKKREVAGERGDYFLQVKNHASAVTELPIHERSQ